MCGVRIQWRVGVEWLFMYSVPQIYPGVGKASVSIESRENTICQINGKSKELAVVHKLIVPAYSPILTGEGCLVPGFRICRLCGGRAISGYRKVTDGKEMRAQQPTYEVNVRRGYNSN